MPRAARAGEAELFEMSSAHEPGRKRFVLKTKNIPVLGQAVRKLLKAAGISVLLLVAAYLVQLFLSAFSLPDPWDGFLFMLTGVPLFLFAVGTIVMQLYSFYISIRAEGRFETLIFEPKALFLEKKQSVHPAEKPDLTESFLLTYEKTEGGKYELRAYPDGKKSMLFRAVLAEEKELESLFDFLTSEGKILGFSYKQILRRARPDLGQILLQARPVISEIRTIFSRENDFAKEEIETYQVEKIGSVYKFTDLRSAFYRSFFVLDTETTRLKIKEKEISSANTSGLLLEAKHETVSSGKSSRDVERFYLKAKTETGTIEIMCLTKIQSALSPVRKRNTFFVQAAETAGFIAETLGLSLEILDFEK